MLVAWIDAAVERRFVREQHRATLVVDEDPARLLDALATTTVDYAAKWIDRERPVTP